MHIPLHSRIITSITPLGRHPIGSVDYLDWSSHQSMMVTRYLPTRVCAWDSFDKHTTHAIRLHSTNKHIAYAVRKVGELGGLVNGKGFSEYGAAIVVWMHVWVLRKADYTGRFHIRIYEDNKRRCNISFDIACELRSGYGYVFSVDIEYWLVAQRPFIRCIIKHPAPALSRYTVGVALATAAIGLTTGHRFCIACTNVRPAYPIRPTDRPAFMLNVTYNKTGTYQAGGRLIFSMQEPNYLKNYALDEEYLQLFNSLVHKSVCFFYPKRAYRELDHATIKTWHISIESCY